MADMNTYEMLDDVNLTLLAPQAGAAFAIAGYVNGHYANWAAIVQKYAPLGKHLLSIDVQGNPAAGAQCLDVETGDATIGQVVAWVQATQKAGKAANDLRYFPKVYTSAGNVAAVIQVLTAAGIQRSEYMIWSAHYTGVAHICSPKGCGYPQADATQWTSTFKGASLDASLCYGYFFSGPPATPAPVPQVTVPDVKGKRNTEAVTALEAAGLKAGSEFATAGVVVSQTPGAGAKVAKGATVDLGVKADPAPVPVKPPTPVLPPAPVPTPAPGPTPIVDVPQPVEEPKPAPAGKPSLVVYVQEILSAETAAQFGLPGGTILFIPHTVEGE